MNFYVAFSLDCDIILSEKGGYCRRFGQSKSLSDTPISDRQAQTNSTLPTAIIAMGDYDYINPLCNCQEQIARGILVMEYKKQTITDYKRMASEKIRNAIANVENIHLHESFGNRKIGKTLNFNTIAVFACGGMCHKCHCEKYCYAIKDAKRFPKNVMQSRCENFALALRDMDRYFAEIRNSIKRHRTYNFIRFHVSGEILNGKYFAEMVETAKQFPDRFFWTYTKQYAIVNDYIRNNGKLPKNMVVMFSEWLGYPMDNPYHMPIFHFVPKDKKAPKNAFICPGNCDICKKAGCGCIAGKTVYCHEH